MARRVPSSSVSGDSVSDIREPVTPAELAAVATTFEQVWGTTSPVVETALLRAVQHAGGYVAAAYVDGRLVGGSFGFLASHHGEPALHSHLTGVLPTLQGTGAGRALKHHQRAWAAAHGLAWVTWTFDPLVRRNAHFNLRVLGATVDEYLVDFYGPLPDALNAGDESDRLLVVWPVGDAPLPPPAAPTFSVDTPDDIVDVAPRRPRRRRGMATAGARRAR